MVRFKVPPISHVRVAFIGVGGRARSNLSHFLKLEGVRVLAIADPLNDSIQAAIEVFKEAQVSLPEVYSQGPEDYKRLLKRQDIDLVLVNTAWEDHAKQASEVMRSGKHVAIEVPAAITVAECWELVNTAEATGRHCMMLENCCYGREELFVLNLCRLGLLGELLHGEAAYIHELRAQMQKSDNPFLMGWWRTKHFQQRNGNLYPTHGLGPIAQYLNIGRGDQFKYAVSMSSPARGRKLFVEKNLASDHPFQQTKNWACGDMSSTLIKTELGKTILLQWDETTPRPYSRLNLIQGTVGTFAGYPNRLVIEGMTPDTHHWLEGEALTSLMEKYEHPLFKRVGELAVKNGGHGGMDFLMIFRLIECLRTGSPLDQDVYDAASWSVLGPISEASVRKGSRPVSIPDFTKGKWKTSQPQPITD